MASVERRFLDGDVENPGSSGKRWYCLVICSAMAGLQGGCCTTFGPISAAVEPFFGWSDADIALLANWGPIMFLIFAIPLTWLMDNKGVKMSCLASAGLVFLGSLCRIHVVSGDPVSGWLMHAGQVLNAIPGPLAMGIGPLLSASWFPANERTTATSLCAVATYGGSAMMFVLGPWIVRQDANVELRLRLYMLGQCAMAAFLFIGACCMPSQPPFPPSASAQVTRTTKLDGLVALAKQPVFLAITFSYAMASGALTAWGSMLGPIVAHVLPADLAQDEAGWMGFWGALAGMVAGVGLGLLSDTVHLRGRKKPLVLAASALGSFSYFLFSGLCSRLLKGGERNFITELYAASILGALSCNAMIPLFFEMAVETAYPVAEGLTTSILTVASNIATLLVLGMQNLPGIGTQWMNWCCAAACFLPIILITPFPELHHRLDFDQSREAIAESYNCQVSNCA